MTTTLGKHRKAATAPYTVAVYTLQPKGWWATWVPGLMVMVHADERVPEDVLELMDDAQWDGYPVPDGADGGKVRTILEDNGHRVDSMDWMELPGDYWD